MKLATASLTVALFCAAPGYGQDGTATPDKGTTATPPGDSKPNASGQSGVGVEAPKIDPKLIIDVLKHLTKPRPRLAPPPAPLPVEPARPVVAAPVPAPPPVIVTPSPRHVPTAAPAAAAPPIVKPRSSPPPAAKTPPKPPPIAVAEPAPSVEPVIAAPAEPAPPPLRVTAVREASVAAPVPALAAQRNASLLSQSPFLLLALLAAAAATIAAATAWSRARRLGRTRAALSLDPRLDLAEGSCSTGGLALACPPMSIRTRLDFV
jgi:hypothetical protein